ARRWPAGDRRRASARGPRRRAGRAAPTACERAAQAPLRRSAGTPTTGSGRAAPPRAEATDTTLEQGSDPYLRVGSVSALQQRQAAGVKRGVVEHVQPAAGWWCDRVASAREALG